MTLPLAITLAEEAPDAAPFVLRGPFARTIPEAAAIGYDAVELHVPDPAALDAGSITAACARDGLRVGSLGTGMAASRDGLTITHQDADRRAAAMERMRGFIVAGARLEAVVILGLIRGLVRDAGGKESYLARLRPALSTLLDEAEAQGVTLVLEAVNRYESDILNTVAETSAFIRSFGSDRLRLHVDTFHMNIEEADVPTSLLAAAGLIGHVHAADSNRQAPGQGHFDFAPTIAALEAAGYGGVVAVECLPLPDPGQAARLAHRGLHAAMRRERVA